MGMFPDITAHWHFWGTGILLHFRNAVSIKERYRIPSSVEKDKQANITMAV